MPVTVTTSRILSLIPPRPTNMTRGAVMAAKGNDNTAALRRFLDDLIAQPQPTSTDFVHPGKLREGMLRDGGPLTPAELAWLDRLPSDPSKVSFEDAKTLAQLDAALRSPSNTTGPKAQPGDLRLVRAIWGPVREVYDLREAEAELSAAKQPYPPIPASAGAALAEAIAAENEQLRPEEAGTRAAGLITDATNRRRIEGQQRLEAAQARIAELEAAQAQRTATTPAASIA